MIKTLDFVTLQELSAFDPGKVLVLTVNNRHARRLLADLSAGLGPARSVMEIPDIIPLSAWLRQAADQLSFQPACGLASRTVDSFGARLLWQRVIAELEAERALLDVSLAARLAAEADHLMDDWRIDVPSELETVDFQEFKLWRAHYKARLAELGMDDANQASERVHDAMTSGMLQMPFTTLVLAGFNDVAPRLAGMLEAMASQGVRLLRLDQPVAAASTLQRLAAPDPDSEWRLAAKWAAAQLAQNPEGRYAIVAARLENDVVLAHRSLRAALGSDAEGKPVPYNVAVARPLSEWPLVRAALQWLKVLASFAQRHGCEPADLGQALLSGACAGAGAEAAGRALIDAHWRRHATIRVSSGAFTALLGRHAPRLGAAWAQCQALLDENVSAATTDIWAKRFRSWLQALGFPGQSRLSSHAFQVLEAFDGLIDKFARQSVVLGQASFGAAAGLLARLARETPFQPQRDPAARLDVLGFLESEGGRWDGVWLLGLTDDVLPAAPRPNPLIPLAALRQAQAPRATPERELDWASGMYAALVASAPQVWISHALHEGEREQRLSPYIAGLAVVDAPAAIVARPAMALEYVRDERGPALEEGATTGGGIGVIDTQARNPLWAFAKYRLGASELPKYAVLSDQNARGLLLHRAAELVWRLVPDQDALRRLHEEGGLTELISNAVLQAADECLQDDGQALRALEAARSEKILHDWLMQELARSPFRVRDVEQDYEWAHGPLRLSLRLDRIDQLDDERLAVIDYKSGSGNIDPRSNWMRNRPVGLQLPFYAAVLAQEGPGVAALALAKLHARGIEFKGLADGDYGLFGVASLNEWEDFAGMTWNQLMAQWRENIHGLADEFAGGWARNQSIHPNDIKYCDVVPFLRLTEEYQRVD
jgi:probable DNA repair protein